MREKANSVGRCTWVLGDDEDARTKNRHNLKGVAAVWQPVVALTSPPWSDVNLKVGACPCNRSQVVQYLSMPTYPFPECLERAHNVAPP